MSTHEIDQTLTQVEAAIELLNGQGFQKQVNIPLPPFGSHEVKAKLDDVWGNPKATGMQRARATQLRERLRQKCGV